MRESALLFGRWSAWRCLLIITAILCVYAPALAGGWFWDDSALIANNTDLRTLAGLARIWSFDSDWPLSGTAFWIEWHLFGPFPFGYHAVNIVMHAANAFLVWNLFSRVGLRWAWLGGLLFAVHPLAVESVAWASETKNTLSLFFALLSLLAWIDVEEGKGGYWRCLLFYTLALLAKTSGLMLPAVFLLYAWWKRGANTSSDAKRTIPFWLIALLLGFITFHYQADTSAESADIRARGIVERCLQSSAAFDFYLGKFFWPSSLMPIYPVPSRAALGDRQLLALPLLVGLFVGLVKLRDRLWARVLLLGLGFFGLNLLPVLGFAEMTYLKFSWVADHLVYLPMIGLVGFSVCLIETLSRRLSPAGRGALVGVVLMIAALLAWNARNYAARFANEEQMWSYNVGTNPSAWAARNNLGCAFLQSGRVTIALAQFDAALSLNPVAADAHANRGLVFMQTGQYEESIIEFETALRLHPGHKSAGENLQIARAKVADQGKTR